MFQPHLLDDHVGDLDDGVFLRFRENAFPSGALDVEAEDPEGRDVGPLALGLVGDEVVPGDVHLNLTTRPTT